MLSCRARLVTMDENWLYHYDSEIKQQSMEWRHSGSPHRKKFRVQKSAGKFLSSIFWDQDGILLIDYLPKGQTINAEYYSLLLVQLKDILKEKRRGAGSLPRGSCSCTKMLRLTEHWSPTLFSGSGPVGLPPVPWTEKTIERSLFFFRRGEYCFRGDLAGRTNLWFFLSGLQKLERRAKKCTELHGEYVE